MKINKVYGLPNNVIAEINEYIDKGFKAEAIHTLLKKFEKKCIIPKIPSITSYIALYLKGKKPEIGLKQLVQQDASGLSNTIDNVDDYAGKDKKEVLEDLILRMDKRMRLIEQAIKNNPDFQYDRVFTNYIREMRMVLETLAKLSGELHDEKTTIINIVRNQTDCIFTWYNDILKVEVPEKYKEIQKKVREKVEQFSQSTSEEKEYVKKNV